LFHLDITLRTVAFTHWACIRLCSRLVNESGHGFIVGNINIDTFLR
jgi:hypothetical protein